MQVHRLAASYRPERHDRREIEPETPGELDPLAPPPRWMSRAQKVIWTETLAVAPKSILRRVDQQLFTHWVVLAARFEGAARAQNRRPLASKTGVLSSYLRLERQTAEAMVRLASVMGFTPVARARLGQPAVKAASEDEWSELKRVPVRGAGEKAA